MRYQVMKFLVEDLQLDGITLDDPTLYVDIGANVKVGDESDNSTWPYCNYPGEQMWVYDPETMRSTITDVACAEYGNCDFLVFGEIYTADLAGDNHLGGSVAQNVDNPVDDNMANIGDMFQVRPLKREKTDACGSDAKI